MSAFTSGKRAELGLANANHDPEPWRHQWPYEYRARPEFDVPENPILIGVRRFVKEEGALTRHDISDLIYSIDDHIGTPEQCEHAIRVLSKLAALA